MSRIVITEFMDERAVAQLRAAHDVLYDPMLVDDPVRLHAEAGRADALIVRNRTQVRGELLAALGKGRIIYSPIDITTGLLGARTLGIPGYQPESACRLVTSIIQQGRNAAP